MTRQPVLVQLAALINAVESSHPVRVAIDGVDGSGKTSLSNELAPLIRDLGRVVIQASIDGFHNPRSVRYQQGPDAPEGYYLYSFDNDAVLRNVLIPLGPGGDRKIRRAVFDFRKDRPIHQPFFKAGKDAILLFDGVFLLRPELRGHWDFSIFVAVDFEISVSRAAARDVARSDEKTDWESTLAKYNQRYVPGQKIYLAKANPESVADVVMDNAVLECPILHFREKSI